ncbi:hypothetical protein D7Z54_07480 [Salibacterium salarium]|uniref:Uncharacterized protein n=1 Tax=Salibacterium salarium TaxID=284579 RepID=A0A428N653_9BACI|nr:hypothetical protein [Salibacterium salarium]RSL33950.1 hypothetical protein D7Z54_07480 [Salibacterium salarium]
MEHKNLKSFGIPVGFFLLGVVFLIIGANGRQNAVSFSKPNNAVSWSTSDSLIKAFTIIPMIIGISFFLLFVSTFTISFYNWQKGFERSR